MAKKITKVKISQSNINKIKLSFYENLIFPCLDKDIQKKIIDVFSEFDSLVGEEIEIKYKGKQHDNS